MKAGDLIQHIGSGEEFVFAENQKSIPGLEWLHTANTVYGINRAGHRIALYADFVRVVDPVTRHASRVTQPEVAR
jgi:hypothetical protein